ncbi:MAG: ribosome maturation factor RimM [Cytophagaceae bacterium]|nr:ribosome maturation factor RimM [Cytophagaceae bacterium]MDW8456446.1 ribosome maturation factor RimM [Cytophagaceae bacterium]
MKHKGLVDIGFVKKTHGLKGEVKIHLLNEIKLNFKKLESVYLIILSKPVPFFVERATGSGNELIVKFEDTNTLEQAQKLCRLTVCVHEDCIIKDKYDIYELIGFHVQDMTLGSIGRITDVQHLPAGHILVVLHKNSEVLVPFSEPIIQNINPITRVVHTLLPDGLLSIYTGD